MSHPTAMFTSFTEEDAERCPGNWIAICIEPRCNFQTTMSASGYSEAFNIAMNNHIIANDSPKVDGVCDHFVLEVGRVPDR